MKSVCEIDYLRETLNKINYHGGANANEKISFTSNDFKAPDFYKYCSGIVNKKEKKEENKGFLAGFINAAEEAGFYGGGKKQLTNYNKILNELRSILF